MDKLDITKTCFVCNTSLEVSDVVEVKARGIANLHKYSLLREDGYDKILKTVESIVLHKDCRKKYIQDKYINQAIKINTESVVSNISPKKKIENFIAIF